MALIKKFWGFLKIQKSFVKSIHNLKFGEHCVHIHGDIFQHQIISLILNSPNRFPNLALDGC